MQINQTIPNLFTLDILGKLEKECDLGILCKTHHSKKEYTCLLSILNAFLPNSNIKPNVKRIKKIIIIAKPYISVVYALTL